MKTKIEYVINIGNYSSIRVGAEGEEPAEVLIRHCEDVIRSHGRGDDATMDLIISYIQRVFPTSPVYIKELDEPEQVQEQEEVHEEDQELEHEEEEKTIMVNEKIEVDKILLNCVDCGDPITQKQGKISQMFTGKNLCAKCVEKFKGEE